jgi:hypothetical protein
LDRGERWRSSAAACSSKAASPSVTFIADPVLSNNFMSFLVTFAK